MQAFQKVSTIKSSRGDYEAAFREEEPSRLGMFFSKLCSPFTFWIVVFVALYIYLQREGAYHFFFIEQNQLFLYDSTYIKNTLFQPAGLVQLIVSYCMQYFALPHCGALMISVLLTLIGIQTSILLKHIAPLSNLLIFSLLPVVTLLFMVFEVNYSYTGIVAYYFMMVALSFYFYIDSIPGRITYSVVVSILLFFFAGAVAFLFAVCIFLWELTTRFTRAYGFIFPPIIIALLAFLSVYNSWVGEYRYMLIPDGYYNTRLQPDSAAIYLSWISVPVLMFIALCLRGRTQLKLLRRITEMLLQLVVVVGLLCYGMTNYARSRSDFHWELDYYVRNEQWDKIIRRCGEEKINNYLFKTTLNLALAEKGQLADRMFDFEQSGLQSIYIQWNSIPYVSTLLSDVYFSMGHIALSQRMAFESNVSDNDANPRMIKRLIQTNLIYGTYPVAEKYIAKLEKTKYYKDWAHEKRKYLWNDEAVEADSLLGIKRKCLLSSNSLSEMNGIDTDLQLIAEQNPEHHASIQYAGALFLLIKDMPDFKLLLEKNYGTDVLPTLPKSFQEAVVIYAEKDTAEWHRYNLPNSVIQKYNQFRMQYISNRSNASLLPTVMRRDFGDTYWYYFMFKKVD